MSGDLVRGDRDPLAARASPGSGWTEQDARQGVEKVLEKYRRKSEAWRREASEEDVKKDLLDDLFRALGWDMGNDRTEDEVVAERPVGRRKRFDYAFRLNHVTRVILEAKKLSVWTDSGGDDEEAVLDQAAEYAYLKGVGWAIASNFEHTVLINADAKDRSHRIVVNLRAEDYITEFDELLLLSRAAISTRVTDRKAEARGAKYRRRPVDEVLLGDMKEFRRVLASSILGLNRPTFSEDEPLLEEVVQRLLDRLIFVRVAEDRGIEERALRAILNEDDKGSLVRRVKQTFEEYHDRYDSDLFDAHLIDEVRVDSVVLERVLRGLYRSSAEGVEYDFAVMGADVLGQMYERYLSWIMAKRGRGAQLKDGTAERKKQGIYYTPAWVADLIVREALKEAGWGKAGGPEASRLRLLDPACGSGSFLLRAFDRIWATRAPPRASTQAGLDEEGVVRASRAILRDNLFGVDLDGRAVEIARLNLMVKAAETRRLLPALNENVVRGNSLTDETSLDGYPLVWRDAFPRVFTDAESSSGFDVVVGNPPYVSAIELRRSVPDAVRQYWKRKYKETDKGAIDLYILFLHQALSICREGGVVGMITPNKYLSSPYGTAFRDYVRDNHTLLQLIDLSQVPVFDDPAVYPVVSLIRKGKTTRPPRLAVTRFRPDNLAEPDTWTVGRSTLTRLPAGLWGPLLSENIDLVEKIVAVSDELQAVADVQATTTAAEADAFSPLINEAHGVRIINTGTIDRYRTTWGSRPFRNKGESFLRPLLDTSSSSVARNRRELYQSPKIVFAKMVLRPEGFLDARGEYASLNTNCIHSPRSGLSLGYLEAILNSKLMAFVYAEFFQGLRMSGGWFQVQAPQLRLLPIARASSGEIRSLESAGKEMHELQNRLTRLPSQHTDEGRRLTHEVERLDARIDEAVHRIYGLNSQEVDRVEEALTRVLQGTRDAPDEAQVDFSED